MLAAKATFRNERGLIFFQRANAPVNYEPLSINYFVFLRANILWKINQ
jgi:hypothetical protein